MKDHIDPNEEKPENLQGGGRPDLPIADHIVKCDHKQFAPVRKKGLERGHMCSNCGADLN